MATRSTMSVIGFVDIDSFECQLWQRDFPELRGHPCVVANKSGRIVSVTNEAKQLGVSRSATPSIREARRICPTVHAFVKPNVWGKPDSKKTRYGTWEILDCIRNYCSRYGDDLIIELASSDELYIDISAEITRGMDRRMKSPSRNWPLRIPPNVVLEGCHKTKPGPFKYYMQLEEGSSQQHIKYIRQDEARLALGSLFMSDLCNFLFAETQLTSAAGVASNKLLGKVGCGINKPGKVTIFHEGALIRMSKQIPIENIPGLGGAKGETLISEFGAKFVSDLRRLTLKQLETRFDPIASQRIFSWAQGNDSQAVRQEYMKDGLTCNKPTGDITTMSYLKATLSNLCNEVLSRLEEEKTRHHRTVDNIRLGCTYLNAHKSKMSMNELLYIDDITKLKELPLKALELIVSQPDFSEAKFTILELKIVVKDFVPMNSDADVLQEMFRGKLLLGPSNELAMNCKTQPNSVFNDWKHIGSFRTTADQKYSSKNVNIPKLIPWSRLQALKGTFLGEGYEEAQSTLISDHTAYYELKHRCFIQWLKEAKYLDNVESKKFKKPDFIAFSGRFADPLRSPEAKLYADWELYALNFRNIIYFWDEKKPQIANTSQSFYGINFERLVTRNEADVKPASEYEMMYVVSEVALDSHQLLVVSNIDAEDENGDWVQVTAMNKIRDPNMLFHRLLKLWSQCVIPGVQHILIGTKQQGVVKNIKMKSLLDLAAELGDSPAKCMQFQSRFLSFVKSHLPVSDRNTVKKFSWTCGSLNVVCRDVQQQEIPNLVFPRLYTSYLKSLEKVGAAKERTNSSIA